MTDKDAFYKQIADLVAQIQAELVSFGYQGSPDEPPVKVNSAFGAGSMSFTGWLWSVFLPRVTEILRQQGNSHRRVMWELKPSASWMPSLMRNDWLTCYASSIT